MDLLFALFFLKADGPTKLASGVSFCSTARGPGTGSTPLSARKSLAFGIQIERSEVLESFMILWDFESEDLRERRGRIEIGQEEKLLRVTNFCNSRSEARQ